MNFFKQEELEISFIIRNACWVLYSKRKYALQITAWEKKPHFFKIHNHWGFLLLIKTKLLVTTCWYVMIVTSNLAMSLGTCWFGFYFAKCQQCGKRTKRQDILWRGRERTVHLRERKISYCWAPQKWMMQMWKKYKYLMVRKESHLILLFISLLCQFIT